MFSFFKRIITVFIFFCYLFCCLLVPVKAASASPTFIPTLSYSNGHQEVIVPDWNKITWSNLPPIKNAGWIEIPPQLTQQLGYNPSRSWNAGTTPDKVIQLGDVAEAFGLQEFALQHISLITGLNLSNLSLKDFDITSEQTISSLIQAIPGLEQIPIDKVKPVYDLVSKLANGTAGAGDFLGLLDGINIKGIPIGSLLNQIPALGSISLGNLDLSKYALSEIPGLALTPLKEFGGWQQSLISQVPGLNLVPFGLFPIAPGLGIGAVAKADIVWGKSEYGDPKLNDSWFVSGSAKNGTTEPRMCSPNKPCAYLELSDLAGVGGPMNGKRWASGETQQVPGGNGVLGALNNGMEPTGRLVFGPGFKVAITHTDESTGQADLGIYLRACAKGLVDLGCSPYFIGPIPLFSVQEKDLVILGSGSPPVVRIPSRFTQQIQAILEKEIAQAPTLPTPSTPPSPPIPLILKNPTQINKTLARALETVGNFRTGNGHSPAATKNGQLACMWAVNQVLNNAGIAPLGKGTLAVKVARTDLKNGRGNLISQKEANTGDLVIVDAGGNRQHIGVCLNNGCTKVKSNSSSKASFSWISNPSFSYPGSPYNGATPEFWRVKK